MANPKHILDFPDQAPRQSYFQKILGRFSWRVLLFLSALLALANVILSTWDTIPDERAENLTILLVVEIFILPLVCILVAGPSYFILFSNKKEDYLSRIALFLYNLVNQAMFAGIVYDLWIKAMNEF